MTTRMSPGFCSIALSVVSGLQRAERIRHEWNGRRPPGQPPGRRRSIALVGRPLLLGGRPTENAEALVVVRDRPDRRWNRAIGISIGLALLGLTASSPNRRSRSSSRSD